MNQRMNKKKLIIKQWPILFILAGIICLTTTTAYGGNRKMDQQPLYDFKDALTIEPQIYKINRSTFLSLFPVPFDNAVGTNSMTNAVTILSFPNGKLQEDQYFKNVVDDIRGSGVYLPLISRDRIGFALGRLFFLFNFKTDTAKLYRLAFSIGKTPEKMAIADAEKMRFLVEVESMNNKSNDPWDVKHYLQLIELVGDTEVKLIKEISSDASIWSVVSNRIFLWQFNEKKLGVYDMNFEPSQHPLGDLIKKNIAKVDFGLIHIHPQLLFAILDGNTAYCLSWKNGRNQNPKAVVSSTDRFSFSPDGKWINFKRKDYSVGREYTYLMPISEKYPHFLGSPILLRKRPFDPDCSTWTTNPIAFVDNDGEFIFRWELTKEAQKLMMGDDFDKYSTFHDYIVAKDLEKLTREKKQGLGK